MNRPLEVIHANMRAHRDTPLQFVSIRVFFSNFASGPKIPKMYYNIRWYLLI